jgi:hypothetical protein
MQVAYYSNKRKYTALAGQFGGQFGGDVHAFDKIKEA